MFLTFPVKSGDTEEDVANLAQTITDNAKLPMYVVRNDKQDCYVCSPFDILPNATVYTPKERGTFEDLISTCTGMFFEQLCRACPELRAVSLLTDFKDNLNVAAKRSRTCISKPEDELQAIFGLLDASVLTQRGFTERIHQFRSFIEQELVKKANGEEP